MLQKQLKLSPKPKILLRATLITTEVKERERKVAMKIMSINPRITIKDPSTSEKVPRPRVFLLNLILLTESLVLSTLVLSKTFTFRNYFKVIKNKKQKEIQKRWWRKRKLWNYQRRSLVIDQTIIFIL